MGAQTVQGRANSATITLLVVIPVLFVVLNWPYQYVAVAVEYLYPPSAGEFVFESQFFSYYQLRRGGFPFAYVRQWEDDPVGQPHFWSWWMVVLNCLIGLGVTIAAVAAARWPRNTGKIMRIACGVGLVGLVGVLVAISAWFASQTQRDQALAQRLSRRAAVLRAAHVPSPLTQLIPRPILSFCSRIRGVYTFDQVPETVVAISQIPTLTSLGTVRQSPTVETLDFLSQKSNFNHLSVRGAELDGEQLAAIGRIKNLRWLQLGGCVGLQHGLCGISKLEKLRRLDLMDSDIRLSSVPKSDWPTTLTSLLLTRPPDGTDSLTLDGLTELLELSVRRSDISVNDDVVKLDLRNLFKLSTLSLETMQRYSLRIENAPLLKQIYANEQELIFRSVSGARTPTTLCFSDVYIKELPSLQELSFDALDLNSFHYENVPNLQRLSISLLAVDDLRNSISQHKLPPDRVQQWIESLGNSDGPLHIDLSTLPLGKLDLKPLTKNKRIRKLDLSYCGIDGSQLADLAALPRLKSLDVRGCPISDQEAADMLRRGLPLERMLVSNEQFDFIEIINQANLREFVGTEAYQARRIKIRQSPQLEAELMLGAKVEMLDIHDAYSLQGLSVNGPLPPDAAVEGIRDLRFFAIGGDRANDDFCKHVWQCADLDHLTVAYGKLSRDALKNVGMLTKLTVLTLPGSGLDDEIFASNWQRMRLLSDIDFSETRVSKPTLDFLTGLSNLQKVSLNHCPLAQADLASLTDVRQLIELELSGIGITADTLGGCLVRGMLDRLDLSESTITPEVLDLLSGRAAKSLRFLGLRDCNLSTDSIRRIAESHPHLALDVTGNPIDPLLVAELTSQRRLLDHCDRKGFLRHIAGRDIYGNEAPQNPFDPVRGRINIHQFAANAVAKSE